ncbi:unnamed protein product [Clonostachys solani]|uniref:SURF1-like protein n=1 Tax=Clonostachys solani TaxID=160281 RepID=A0A9N9W0Q0_9HYPO|nr:unnamed protein product [Clonostachys solani]
MNSSQSLLRGVRVSGIASNAPNCARLARNATPRRLFSTTRARPNRQAADTPEFVSIADAPPKLVRAGKRHGPGLIILAIIPITAFALGTWQVQRLGWKTDLIAKYEDRLIRDPLPLPRTVDPAVIPDFDHRRVVASGHFRHDQEMLVGPRMREGSEGYMVITPLQRKDASTVLVNRGWIDKKHRDQRTRPDGLPTGEVFVEGLLREPWKKNSFTPDNRPERGEFFFPDVKQMAELTGSQPVWIEATAEPDFLKMVDFEARGIPYGRAAEVALKNNHAQYIFTWYSLAVATSIMLYMVIKKPSSEIVRRARHSKGL